MILYRLKDVPVGPLDIVFRQSTWQKVFAVFFALGFACILLPFFRSDPFAFYAVATIMGIVVLVFLLILIKTLRVSNWLVRCNEDGLVINFRSYLNDGFPEDDVVAVGLKFAEIAWVGTVGKRLTMPSARDQGVTTTERTVYLDIKPTCPDSVVPSSAEFYS